MIVDKCIEQEELEALLKRTIAYIYAIKKPEYF